MACTICRKPGPWNQQFSNRCMQQKVSNGVAYVFCGTCGRHLGEDGRRINMIWDRKDTLLKEIVELVHTGGPQRLDPKLRDLEVDYLVDLAKSYKENHVEEKILWAKVYATDYPEIVIEEVPSER